MATRHIPEGSHTVTPYLIVDNAATALDFYRAAFGATEKFRMPMGDKIGHAEFAIGDSNMMISDEWPDMDIFGPRHWGGATTMFMIYVEDVDAAFDHAIQAGGKVDRPVENQFWGDRTGTLIDPYGHKWTLATHVEDVSPEDMQERMAAYMPKP